MPAIEIGRICIKTYGREVGRKCVVLDVIDKNFVFITGPKQVTGIKKRRVNINHIEPTMEKIEVNRDSSDEEVVEALKKANKIEEMKSVTKVAIT